jgi:hypothetical protein
MRVFFPGILILVAGAFLLTHTIQGKDILINAFQSNWSGWFFVTTLLFWALVTWYTSRLISYNNYRKIYLPETGLVHFPRWLGFNCLTTAFTAIYFAYPSPQINLHPAAIFLISCVLYLIYNLLFKSLEDNPSLSNTWLQRAAWFISIAASVWMAQTNTPAHYLLQLPFLQFSLLFLITTRRNKAFHISRDLTATTAEPHQNDILTKLIKWIYNNPHTNANSVTAIRIPEERNFFAIFLTVCLAASGLYVTTLYSIDLARMLSPLPILLLGFGLLLGAGNILSMLSFKLKINFHFLALAAIICAGFFRETHGVGLITLEKNMPLHTGRPKLRPHFNRWMAARAKALEEANGNFPIYLILSDGGASRSAYWTASVLSRLDSLNKNELFPQVFSLSGSSGGSLGNLSFLAAQKASSDTRTKMIQAYLSTDFLSFPLAHLIGSDIILPLIPGNRWGDRAAALEKSLQQTGTPVIDSFMVAGFSSLNPSNDTMMKTPVVFVNCTRMQDGRPAAVSNIQLDEKTFGHRMDVLRELGSGKDLPMAATIVLGARFPYFSPAGRIHNNYYVDAGYMDNSGAGITHEMLMDLHTLVSDSIRKNPLHPYGKIRFHVLHITNDPASKSAPPSIHPLLNDLAAPLLTLTNAHARQTDFNNLRLKKYLQEINGDEESYQVINLYENGLADELPMNWKLSPKALEKINKRLSTTQTSLR